MNWRWKTPLLLFCTNRGPTDHRIWVVPAPTLTGPRDVAAGRPFAHPHLYAPRLVPAPDGSWSLIGFLDMVDGAFVGQLTDPAPVRYDPATGLTIDAQESTMDERARRPA
jgi:beta-fructofuranosidase